MKLKLVRWILLALWFLFCGGVGFAIVWEVWRERAWRKQVGLSVS
jgi:hypothetical protein